MIQARSLREVQTMSYIPTPEQAEELVKQYNKEAFHIHL